MVLGRWVVGVSWEDGFLRQWLTAAASFWRGASLVAWNMRLGESRRRPVRFSGVKVRRPKRMSYRKRGYRRHAGLARGAAHFRFSFVRLTKYCILREWLRTRLFPAALLEGVGGTKDQPACLV